MGVSKEFAKPEEAMRIGTMQRTPRIWKRNGNLKTVGKTILRTYGEPDEGQLARTLRKVFTGH